MSLSSNIKTIHIYIIYIYGMGLRLFQVQHFARLSLIQYKGSTEHRLELILISFLSRTTKNNKKENWATNLCSVDNQFSNEELHIEGVWSATFHFVVQESHPSRHFFRWDTLIQSRQGEIINFRFYRWKQLLARYILHHDFLNPNTKSVNSFKC